MPELVAVSRGVASDRLRDSDQVAAVKFKHSKEWSITLANKNIYDLRAVWGWMS